MAFIEPQKGTMAKIKVVGVGGGGQNAVSSMVDSGKIFGVEFVAMNTDLQALESASTQMRLQLGPDRTHGLGSGSDPQVGLEAAEESIEDIKSHLQGSDMVFIASGMGGGTGTGGASVVAQVSKSMGALTVGVVTKPFEFEGKRRMNQAEQGIRDLKDQVDALIIIPNEKLLSVVEENLPLRDAFKVADQVIGKAVEGISDLITSTGLVNVDFADVKAIMQNAGSALMGVGEADGENRAEKAAKAAVNSPLLDVDIQGSTGVLINIVGDSSLSMHEVDVAAKIISNASHEGANIIFGANVDPEIDGIRVTVIATGFDTDYTGIKLVERPGIKDEEVLEQIDARIDRQKGMIQDRASDPEDEFNIEEMRKQLEEEERLKAKGTDDGEGDLEDTDATPEKEGYRSESKLDEEKDSNDSSKGSFWRFISSKERK